MRIIRLIRGLTRRIDGVILRLLGEHRDPQTSLSLPADTNALELRRKFIKDYVATQPSLLQLILLKVYVTTRHGIGNVGRKLIRIYRRSRA
jgi:hypothetical protein